MCCGNDAMFGLETQHVGLIFMTDKGSSWHINIDSRKESTVGDDNLLLTFSRLGHWHWRRADLLYWGV